MKKLIVLFPVLMLFNLPAQVISTQGEYVVVAGVKTDGRFTSDDDEYYYFVPDGATIERKIPKKIVTDYHWNDISKQPYKYSDSGQVEYSDVVEVADASKSQLYHAARVWFAKTYRNSKEVLEMDDKESGVLIGTGFSDIQTTALGMTIDAKLWSTMKVQVKDGRYKVTINNIDYENYPSANVSRYRAPINERWPDGKNMGKVQLRWRTDALITLQSLFDSLKAAMLKAKEIDDNW